MATQRIPLAQLIETRDGTLTKDSKCVNGYWESSPGKKEFVKRPGLKKLIPTGNFNTVIGPANGMTTFTGTYGTYLIFASNTSLFQADITDAFWTPSSIGTVDLGGKCSFASTLNNTYLFIQGKNHSYTLDASISGLGFSEVSNTKVSSTTITTAGANYSNGVTVTFSAAPSGGTTATGTSQITNGIFTGITITNPGKGYLTAPTITITPATAVTSLPVTNTSGTYVLTSTNVNANAVYVGMTVTGTGIPANTKVVAASGSYPLVTISLNNATTAAVTSATFKDLGTGATATSALNGFPSEALARGAVYLDTYIIVGTKSGKIYTSNPNDPTTWNALNYITAESDPDTLIGIAKHLNYVLGFGQYSTDFFYDAGTYPGSPLAPAPSYKMEIGCAAGDSIQSFEQSVIWIGQSKAQGPAVYLMDGVAPVKVSTAFIDRILQNSKLEDDTTSYVTSYTFKMNGHMFYVLTLDDLNVTIVYDVSEKAWYQWTMWAKGDQNTVYIKDIYAEQKFYPSFCTGVNASYFNPNYRYYLMDSQSGAMYVMADYYYTDDGAPIYYRAITGNIDNGSTNRKFYNRVEIVGDKIPAIMNIRSTSDDYRTFSPYRQVDLSKSRSQLYQCGQSRRRAWEFLCTDNQPLRIEAVEVDFEVGGLEQQIPQQQG
jgi:hypothetical protein